VHGEHSASEGGVYDVSNKQRLGITQYQAVKQMYDGVKQLIALEQHNDDHDHDGATGGTK
jgi:protein-arginine kinase